MAAKKARKNGTRVIYTAHGFHFYKGAPLKNWLLFYPVERHLAKFTDTIITINQEDYARAKNKFGKRCRDIEYIPGVGVDEKKFKKKLTKAQKSALRKKLKLKDNDFVLICVGRLDKNKNQGFLIKTMEKLVEEDEKYHLLLVGPDELDGKYQKLANKLNVEKHVHFLGKRNDIPELLKISDVALSVSKREGLGLNVIEALFSEKPVTVSENRGHRDIVFNGANGYIVKSKDTAIFANAIKASIENCNITNSKTTLKNSYLSKFCAKNSYENMARIYEK